MTVVSTYVIPLISHMYNYINVLMDHCVCFFQIHLYICSYFSWYGAECAPGFLKLLFVQEVGTYVPYSLKLSRTKIFMNFVVFEAPT